MESSLGYEWISFNQTAEQKKDKLMMKKKIIITGNQQVVRMTDIGT